MVEVVEVWRKIAVFSKFGIVIYLAGDSSSCSQGLEWSRQLLSC